MFPAERPTPDPNLEAKHRVAAAAVRYVKDGMRLGLGSGSTAELVVAALGLEVARGLRVRAVTTSERTARLAGAAGIPVEDFTHGTRLDLAIDGADEVDPALGLIKGHGGALLYEKIVASAADVFLIVVDASKRVERLGRVAVPVEVVPFAEPLVREALAALGAAVAERRTGSGQAFRTQAGHHILDAHFGVMADAGAIAARLDAMVGVVEHGLFLGMADRVLIADAETIEILTPSP